MLAITTDSKAHVVALFCASRHTSRNEAVLLTALFFLLTTTVVQAEIPTRAPFGEAPESQAVQEQMNGIFRPFQSLQVFLNSASAFEAEENKQEIKSILRSLKGHFEDLQKVTPIYREQLGFDMNVKLVSALLRDATGRFDSGKKSYAWWRLKKLPTQCFSCHSTYKVNVHFSPAPIDAMPIPDLAKAKFLLATRQLGPAKEQLLKVLKSNGDRLEASEALRSLLVVIIRTKAPLKDGIAILKDVAATADLPEDEQADVKEWISELQLRDREHPAPPSTLELAEQEIRQGIGSDSELEIRRDPVSLLFGTGRIHELVEGNTIHGKQHSRALYLLGLAYSELPLFFVNDWPELYLEQCIEEHQGSLNAQAAYRLYRELLFQDFSGISGTMAIPEDVRKHLDELRTKAYSSPTYSNEQARLIVE